MNTTLRPATVDALASFRDRRTRLLMMKAGIAAAVVLLGLLLIVAILDWATFMPDSLRQGLSYTGYFIALIAAWRLGVRFVKEARGLYGAARLMEVADKRMHEKLLSAVELSQGVQENLPDSPEFRARLQDDVAGDLQDFKAERILPTNLLIPWFKVLGGVLLLIIALSFVPGLHLPGFIARAALPFANLSRPSSTKVTIVTPVRADVVVPLASSVPLAVQIDGKIPRRVLVETRTGDSKPSKMELTHNGAQRYEGSVGIGQSSVQYRILAGDAITAWHTFHARPRPRVLEFAKTITPPAYTGLPPQTLTEDHGDLSALDGSVVQVTMKTNQPVEKSTAFLQPNASLVGVNPNSAESLTLAIPIDGKSDAWQITLTARGTGFTNEEASPWRIQTVIDHPPSIGITQPREQLECRTDDTVELVGIADDDIGLAKILVAHAINGADWKETVIQEKAGKRAEIHSSIKLTPLPVKSGDSVIVKLVAVDFKGQKAESYPVRLLIVEDKLNLAQRELAADQRRLAASAKALAEEVRDLRKETEKVRAFDKKQRKNDEQEMQAEAALAKMKQHLAAVDEKSEDLWNKLKETAQKSDNPLKAMELNLAGQRLAELRGQHLKELQEQSQAEDLDERQLKDAANQLANDAETVSQAMEAFAAADSAKAVREAMEHLAPQQTKLAEKAIDANRNPDERGKWQEQQRAALAAAASARKDLEDLKSAIQDYRKRDVNQHLENFDKKMPAVQNSLDSPKQHQAPEYLYGQAHELRNAANQARDASRWFADETAQKAQEMRERLLRDQNPALAALDQARDQMAKAANEKKEQKNQSEPPKEQAADRLEAAARQFKDQSELREQNHQTNNQAALDKNRMGRALQNLAEELRRTESPEQIKAVSDKARQLVESARALESDAMAQDAAASLQQAKDAALAQETPAEQLPAAQAAANQLKQLPDTLRRAQSNQEAANAAQEAANNAQWQRDETQNQLRQLADQKQNGQQPQPMAPEQNRALEANAKAEAKLAEAISQFAPKVAAAREQVEAMTPKLSELAKNTSDALQRSQEQTQQTAQAAENNQPAEQTAQQANALMPQAKEDAQKLSDLQAALRQEANAADLQKEADRQMARAADVGMAQIRQQTPQIAQNLQQAAQAQQAPQQQAQALKNAAQAQKQTAQALDQLAQNLQKMEQGQALPEDALAAQQAVEEALGIKQPLDQSYQEAQQIAKIMEQAQQDPKKALAALEQELKKNPQMQRALGELSEKTAQESQSNLELAQSQPQMAPLATSMGAHDLARVARHQERLDQKAAAQKVAQASAKLKELADAVKANPSQMTPQTAEQASQTGQQAHQAAAETASAQAENTPPPTSFSDAAKGTMLAQALDELDQAVNPMEGGSPQQSQEGQQAQASTQQGQQQGQPQQQQGQGQNPQQSAQQNAQQSLAQANQAQAQQMAQARAQGMVPGQKPPQAAQRNSQTAKGPNQEPAPDASGNMTQGQTNLVVPVLGATQAGDWGHLPTRMAKDLSEASRQEPSPEYRAAIESYYKAIAEKAKK
ncbi:hypothetical protein [Verrucomicrobium sp. BvORR034]|uniref:hypothetical protein n=1 Tax=Verrucomicrobium sp. BvORR034 TaxID=1396418 RepID=UPI0006790E69|nr:hypothetical protein [Verrucomicrobium sp. BvORR034]